MILVWTRDVGARDALALALSRFGYPFRMIAEIAEVAAEGDAVRVLVLGPTFTSEEAADLRRGLRADVALVLIEDTLDPLPASVVVGPGLVGGRMSVPVRARTLRRVLDALLSV